MENAVTFCYLLPDRVVFELKKRTLTNLYNQNPTWLQNAHAKLDWAKAQGKAPLPQTTEEETEVSVT